MAFPRAFLDELRARLALSSVVRQRVELVKAEREYRGSCPFHRDQLRSLYVNDERRYFHCFGCGAHGDAIGFTMRMDQIELQEAVEKLAREAGLDMPPFSP